MFLLGVFACLHLLSFLTDTFYLNIECPIFVNTDIIILLDIDASNLLHDCGDVDEIRRMMNELSSMLYCASGAVLGH